MGGQRRADARRGAAVSGEAKTSSELLVELWHVAVGGHGEQLGGHRGEDAVVAHGVIAQGVHEGGAHQAGVARRADVLQAGEQFLATGRLGGEPGADARAQQG